MHSIFEVFLQYRPQMPTNLSMGRWANPADIPNLPSRENNKEPPQFWNHGELATFQIISNILSLEQYITGLSQAPHEFKPKDCPYCHKKNLWSHGRYHRKADRRACPTLNPIPILRFFCHYCRRTCSLLPECIAPRRWYLWKEQEDCLKARFNGFSIQSIARRFLPSRQTIRRWLHWAFDWFEEFRMELQSRFPSLGYESEALEWWKKLLEKISLSTTMRILRNIGINVVDSLTVKNRGSTPDPPWKLPHIVWSSPKKVRCVWVEIAEFLINKTSVQQKKS